MKNKISKIAVIGCSNEGYEVAKDIVGELKLGKKSSIVIIPHICAKYIWFFERKREKSLSYIE